MRKGLDSACVAKSGLWPYERIRGFFVQPTDGGFSQNDRMTRLRVELTT